MTSNHAFRLQESTEQNRLSSAYSIYESLRKSPNQSDLRGGREYLLACLKEAEKLPDPEIPWENKSLLSWMEGKAHQVGQKYAEYLSNRHAGGPRLYFPTKAHALSFLRQVGPTKLVDGAWLYQVVEQWEDSRYRPLIQTYVDELGGGNPTLNHVAMYQRLLQENGCTDLRGLSDEHYMQGAIQLAIGHHALEFLPEVLGYNLAYEQPPLHILVTAFELAELGYDARYFTLHATIDNAHSGHAHLAAASFKELASANIRNFRTRVATGYRLGDLGLGSSAIISDLNLENEVEEMLERKRPFGQHMHSDYCLIEGRSVNQWLQNPGGIRGFLTALQKRGWIRRHQDPALSRFWRLIDGENAPMLGVFTPYEKQLIYDWIAGDKWRPEPSQPKVKPSAPVFLRHTKAGQAKFSQEDSRSPDTEAFESLPIRQGMTESEFFRSLARLMAPGTHATPAGFAATRAYAKHLGLPGCMMFPDAGS